MMNATRCSMMIGLLAVALLASGAGAQSGLQDVLKRLNEAPTVATSPHNRSYEVLFNAYLDLTEPPFPVGRYLNQLTIHPGMPDWDQVSNWAEANPDMAEAILRCKYRIAIGLPYGRDNVSPTFQRAGLYANIGGDGTLHDRSFPYLDAMETIAALATTESYRRLEAGQIDDGLDLQLALIFILRQLCDREFVDEKRPAIIMLSEALANLRDMFYVYLDRIDADRFKDIAVGEIPFLRPDRNRLFMPEGDRIVAEAILKDVFDHRGMVDHYKFPIVFADIQARTEPLTRIGAARRWAIIADFHGSLDASLERLRLIYDDWWRRWRIQEYDPILDIPTQFSRMNPIRYAAVVHSIRDLEDLFDIRKELIVSVNSTAVAAGLCAYYRTFNTWPSAKHMIYAQFVRKSSDIDPYDRSYGHLQYFQTGSRHSVDTPAGRIWIEPGKGIVYSRGQNHSDNRAARHTDDGSEGDIVTWPPIKALQREQGLIP